MEKYLIPAGKLRDRRLKFDLIETYPTVDQYQIRGALAITSTVSSDTLMIVIGFEPTEICNIDLCMFFSPPIPDEDTHRHNIWNNFSGRIYATDRR